MGYILCQETSLFFLNKRSGGNYKQLFPLEMEEKGMNSGNVGI